MGFFFLFVFFLFFVFSSFFFFFFLLLLFNLKYTFLSSLCILPGKLAKICLFLTTWHPFFFFFFWSFHWMTPFFGVPLSLLTSKVEYTQVHPPQYGCIFPPKHAIRSCAGEPRGLIHLWKLVSLYKRICNFVRFLVVVRSGGYLVERWVRGWAAEKSSLFCSSGFTIAPFF